VTKALEPSADPLLDFERASAIRPVSPGFFEAEVPDGWQQGRGAFGGLVFGLLGRAMEMFNADATRTLRTLSGDIASPVIPGPVRLETEMLRRGSNQSNVQARLRQGDAVLAVATGVFSAPRRISVPSFEREPPERADWDQILVIPVEPPFGPDFARAYEYRPTGPMPFSGGRVAETAGYVRERLPAQRRDAPNMIGLLDAWWPTLFSIDETFRSVATISWMAQLLVDPRQVEASDRLFHTAHMVSLSDGFFVEFRELWSGDTCVAMNQQTFAVLR
jgi:acyl-coenzyme A thioesterase PaaI-like protein